MGFLVGKGYDRCESRLLAPCLQRIAAQLTSCAVFVLALGTTAIANAGKPIMKAIRTYCGRRAMQLTRVTFVALTLAATSIVDAAKPVVYETGYEMIHLIQFTSLHWIDNDRLLFSGMKAGRGERADLRKLYLWDAPTRAVSIYASARAFCFADGKVYYTKHGTEDSKKVVRESPFGAEKEVEKTDFKRAADGSVYSHLTCSAHARGELRPPAPKNRSIVVLKSRDGYLDLGLALGARIMNGETISRNVVLYREDKAIALPLLSEEDFSPFDVAFSEYKRAYVLRPRANRGAEPGILRSWPTGQALTAYLIWPEGRVETVLFPYWPTTFLLEPRPIKGGWILGGGDAKTAGLYMFDSKVMSKIEAGFVRQIAVSPDGCRGAVGIQNRYLEMGTPINVKVFDFCKSGR